MPNWCNNNLIVSGPKGYIKEFKEKAKVDEERETIPRMKDEKKTWRYQTDLSLNAFIPMPKELEGRGRNSPPDEISKTLVEKYGADDWYTWNVMFWGTKWDIDAELYDQNEESLSYMFQSPWSPPTIGILAISKLHPELLFVLEYDESGMKFYGIYKCQNGEVVENDYREDMESGVCPHCGEPVEITYDVECPQCGLGVKGKLLSQEQWDEYQKQKEA